MAQRIELMKQDGIRLQREPKAAWRDSHNCVEKKTLFNAVMHSMQGYRIQPIPIPVRSVPLTPAGESLIVVKKRRRENEGKTLSLIIFMMS
jgi:hypothetical protein